MAKVLIIDDDKGMSRMLFDMVKSMNHDAVCAFTVKDGLREAVSGAFDVVFLDVMLPDGNGLKVLPKIRETKSSPEVVIITGVGDPDGAETAIRNGAWDYLQKPLEPKKLVLPLNRVLQYRDDLKKVQQPPVALKFDGVVGTSPRMSACLDALAQAAGNEANVLITGDTGTGKELYARTIHENSARVDNNLVVVDCAALPTTLVGSILFGHEKGAFTGADKASAGLIQDSHGGTLFLDEVGELPLDVQKMFLRILQEHSFRPIGGRKEVKSDFRLLAATNRDLGKMVKTNKFREDLFFRLRALNIEIPPLRKRTQDIKDLTLYYTARICERYGTETKGLSPDFFETLALYNWPGNIRELINTIEEVLTHARYEPTIYARHLPAHIRIQAAQAQFEKNGTARETLGKNSDSARPLPSLQEVRDDAMANVEQQYLQDLMALTKRNIKEACRISGMSRSRLYFLMQKYNVTRF